MKEEIYRRARSKSASSTPDVRLSVIGGANVGKSAISVRFLTKRFIGEYQQNVESTYRRNIMFGNNVIEYDLKDTSPLFDRLSLISWSTCIAIVYSITDQKSFNVAELILKEVSELLQLNKAPYLKPCIALIANKQDLKHLREVSHEVGMQLSKKYDVAFWEVSASDDYYSTCKPLNSLIVESYFNTISARNPIDAKPRTLSCSFGSPSSRNSRSSLDSNDYSDFDYRVFGGNCPDEDTISITSTTSLKELRRRKTSAHEHTLETLDETNTVDSMSDNNNNNIADDTTKSESKGRFSMPKRDKKRSLARKSTENKSKGMTKSRSYSDLKTFEKEQKQEIELLSKETSEQCLKAVNENSKTGWNKLRKNRKKLSSINMEDESFSQRGNEAKKSVKTKISQIFKQKTIGMEDLQV